MKLQYYLRGLGIGILVTVMILVISPGEKESMSDEEIRARAAQLGMVESSSLTLADIQERPQATSKPQPSEEQTPPPSEEQPAEEQTPPPSETQPLPETVSIVIPGGADSYSVSKLLQEKRLIENAQDFDTYLCDNGYSRSIRVGTYEISVGATWEEIARKISGK